MTGPAQTGSRSPGREHEIVRLLSITLRRITRAISVRSRFLAGRFGLTGPQIAILKELMLKDGACVGELASAIYASQATTTDIVDRLERAGLVNRSRDERDRRRVHVRLTDRGRELMHHCPSPLREEFVEEFSKLADWEQSQILSSLQRVASMMEVTGPEPVTGSGPARVLHKRPRATRAAAR